ncbi:hypothetical protein PVL29_012575 [Vitis rotundifolia]|uniref:Uncharacterized protein n=1 Tax=Vitis rotundifolia TaxID=103349 RepID=A0AA38ZJG8_VITRO|nr:hypothetical protein PVL29_012575 [Vitis rotundifolia]
MPQIHQILKTQVGKPKASKLRQHSYDARYASLVKIAKCLDSCEATEEDVSQVLRRLGDKLLEQDAVIVLSIPAGKESQKKVGGGS